MSNVLKVEPEEIRVTCNELKKLSLETEYIVKRFDLILNKMQLQWEGRSQQEFADSVQNSITGMKQFAVLCKEFSDDILQMANCYMEAESLFAININNELPSTIIE